MSTASPPVRLVVVGGSWGGMNAAGRLLAGLPAPLPVPFLLVLHRSKTSEGRLLERVVARDCGHPVREIEDKDDLTAGTIYIAPADYHVLVEESGVSLTVDDPVNHSRPSVDLTLETAAENYGEHLVAVMLSGLGRDGAAGVTAVRRHGGRIFVQDPDEAERPEMPLAALATGCVDEAAPLATLALRIGDLVGSDR
jgi:two-component system, chemotaxis family, protein-glutamate methylesterase/glutaminase